MGRKEERKLHTDNPNHKRKRIPEFGLSRDGTLDQWQIISHCYENMSRVPKEGLLQSYEPATGNLMPVHKLTHSQKDVGQQRKIRPEYAQDRKCSEVESKMKIEIVIGFINCS